MLGIYTCTSYASADKKYWPKTYIIFQKTIYLRPAWMIGKEK